MKPLISIEDFENRTSDRTWFGTWLGAHLVALDHGYARLRLDVRPEFLREGDSIAGPIVMAVADIAMYAAVMSVYANGKRAVTSDMTMHFLRRPVGDVLWCDTHIVKPGKRIAMCRAELFTDLDAPPVAHVVGSYAIPPDGD